MTLGQSRISGSGFPASMPPFLLLCFIHHDHGRMSLLSDLEPVTAPAPSPNSPVRTVHRWLLNPTGPGARTSAAREEHMSRAGAWGGVVWR